MECPADDPQLSSAQHGSNALLNLDALFAEGTYEWFLVPFRPGVLVLGSTAPAKMLCLAALVYAARAAPCWVVYRADTCEKADAHTAMQQQ